MKNTAIQNITAILHGKAASPLSMLPPVWQKIKNHDAIEAARLFRYHNTPLAMEALSVIGKDLLPTSYPDLKARLQTAETEVEHRTILCLQSLFDTFGQNVPAAFYNALLGALEEDNQTIGRRLFKYKKLLMQDRLWDAVLHAMLLVTPIALYVHSVFSQHGLRFTHMMNCSCKVEIKEDEPPFSIHLNEALKPAYLQNLIAAALEQYGVNASTSGKTRGF